MKRQLTLALGALALILAAGAAQAEHRDRSYGYYGDHYRHHDRGHYDRRGRGHHRGHYRGGRHGQYRAFDTGRHYRYDRYRGHYGYDRSYGYRHHYHRYQPVLRLAPHHHGYRYCRSHGGYFRIGDLFFGYRH